MDTIKQVNVDKLVIKFNTNIPSKTEQLVEFTRSMLHIPVDPSIPKTNNIILEKYPFITADVKYPRKYLSQLNYSDRVDFFFNEGVFTDVLSKYAPRSSKNRSKQYMFEKNVLIMLDILFPTSFPVASNVSMSSDALYGNLNITYPAQQRSIFDVLSMNTSPTFSYLTINGKKYTIQRLVWLNDLLNHPLYYKLIDSYRKYKYDTQDKKMQTQRLRAFKTLLREFQTIRLSTNTNLQEQINSFSDEGSSQLSALFEYVIGYYLEGNVGKNTDLSPMLDVGVSTLNISDPNQPSKEIYVMVDLINKEVSKENKKDVNCSYLDQHLGNQITYLWGNSQMSDVQSWNVMKNRGTFNIDTLGIDKPSSSSSATTTGETGSSRLVQSIPLVDNMLKMNFQTYIVDNAPDMNKRFNDYVSNYNVKYTELFDFLKNNSGYATKIYDYIQSWNKSLDTRSISLVANIQKTLGEIDGVIQGLNTQYSAEVDTTKKDNMRRDIDLHELYKTIIKELLNNENKKKIEHAGGRRTRRNKKHRMKLNNKRSSYRKKSIA